MSREASALLFGKLPAHGDFVARGLVAGEREALDAWLSSELAAARHAMGDGFEAAYDAAPLWHYAGPAAVGWRGLAVAASIDAAGRRFPLFFGWANLDPDEARPAAHAAGDILFTAICDGWDADRLAAAPAPVSTAAAPRASASGWWTSDEAVAFADARPVGLVAAMLTTSAIAPKEPA